MGRYARILTVSIRTGRTSSVALFNTDTALSFTLPRCDIRHALATRYITLLFTELSRFYRCVRWRYAVGVGVLLISFSPASGFSLADLGF